ncbi:MAG: hypothetical protein ACTS2F_23210 [Thainema sp.]
MLNLWTKVARKLPKPLQYRAFSLGNQLRRDAIHLFLLSPPLSGSTVIGQLMATSSHVTVFPNKGEGQFLPAAQPLLLVDQRWNPDYTPNWQKLKAIFYSYWWPSRRIRFEKSPPNIIRAVQLEQTFQPSYFLITIRNPYALVEGLLRRKWPFGQFGPQSSEAPPATASQAAKFWVHVANAQRRNLQTLEHTLLFTYEEIMDQPEFVTQKIVAFLPELESLQPDAKVSSHNVTGRPVTHLQNLNALKIQNLSESQIAEINQVLGQHEELLSYFGYELLNTCKLSFGG